jgi:outer membrane protein OmpA-like peptidoglycan-associated protein
VRRIHFLAALLAAGLSAPPVMAAPDPSVGDVIKALTVSPNRTRGSRPVQQPPAGAPAAHTPATAAPTGGASGTASVATGEGTGAIDLSVQFATGAAQLTPQARHTLDVLGQALTSPQLANVRVRIEGHTDTVGGNESNMLLSQQRAAAAASYLEEKFGITGARIEAIGRGEADPLVRTGDNVNEPRNRRVRVVNISG